MNQSSRGILRPIEDYRYKTEPEIQLFANFAGAAGMRVLEVGIGAGTDFIQWVRAGAEVTGVDLTEEATQIARRRVEMDGGSGAILQADCERLPFSDNSFDMVYSWGVIHHTPDTWRALDEILRVCRPNSSCKCDDLQSPFSGVPKDVDASLSAKGAPPQVGFVGVVA